MDCKELILSEDVRDVLVDYRFLQNEIKEEGGQFCYLPLEQELGVLYIPASFEPLLNNSQYRYTYTPKCYGLTELIENEMSLEVSGILRVQNSPLKLTGKQVLIGFVDTGIRSNLSVFQREDATSCIYSVWDQTDQTGIPPEGFLYGSEYKNQDGVLHKVGAPIGEESVTYDEDGHGSSVASVSLSAAPDAQIVMVKCKPCKEYLKKEYAIPKQKKVFSEADILTGIAYLASVSKKAERPLVICFTMGTNMGSHEADSILDRYLRNLADKRATALVLSAGNEGNLSHHYRGSVDSGKAKEYDEVEIRVAPNHTGFSMEVWGASPSLFSVSIQSPDGELLGPLIARLGQEIRYSFVYSETNLRILSVLAEKSSAKQLLVFRFEHPLEGIWTLRVYATKGLGQSVFHAWLPIEAFLSAPVSFIRPDPFFTMTEPAYVENGMAVTYYDARNLSFSIDSGRGEDLPDLNAPAFSAPGIQIQTVLGPKSGGSMSAAITAGGVAQFLEWAILRKQDPLVTSKGVRNYMIKGAKRQPQLLYPNPLWGYGRMNLEGVFDALSFY